MKIVRVLYFILSIGLISFLGWHYYHYQYNKKIKYVDKAKEELILYFNDICLGAEFSSSKKVTRRWEAPLRLYIVKDKKYPEQIAFIKATLDTLNQLVSDNFDISISTDSVDANGHIYLCSHENIKRYSESVGKSFDKIGENSFGFFSYTYRENVIFKSNIFINTSKPLALQKAAILEEIVQSLGMANDSDLYPNSVFYRAKYDEKKTVLSLSNADKKLIRLLYHPDMKAGLNRVQTDEIIRSILNKE